MSIRRSLLFVPISALTLAACESDAAARSVPGSSADSAAAPPIAEAAPSSASPANAAAATAGPIALGKYGCIETISRLRNGSYEFEFEPRGMVALASGGAYTDPFGNAGSFRYDEAAGAVRFAGGALDGGSATPMEGEPGRIRVVIPAGDRERRWTCSRT